MARRAQPTPPQRAFGTKAWSPFPFAGLNQQDSAIAIADSEFKWIENFVKVGNGDLRALWDVGAPFYTAPAGLQIVSHFPYTIGSGYYIAVFLNDGSAVQVNAVSGATTQIGPPNTFWLLGGSLPACAQWGVLYLLISNRNSTDNYWAWDGQLLYGPGTAAPDGVNLLSTGANYSTQPTVTAFGGEGSGMTFSAQINAGGVVNVNILNPGKNYQVGDVVQLAFSGGGSDSSAILQANLNPGGVTAVNVTAAGSGYTSAPTVTFTGGGGSGASATAVVGTGVSAVNMTATGANYTIANVSFSGGGGSGAIASANIVGGQVVSITLIASGSGYGSAPSVTITGDGTGATAAAAVQGGGIISITMNDHGTGYTSAPTVGFTGGGGSGASAQAILSSNYVKNVTVVNGGSGFVYNPNLLFVGGGGAGAAGVALLTPTSIARIDVVAGGQNYQNAPTVYFSGGSQFGAGSAAAATAVLQNGQVAQVKITNPGSGFETIPAIIFLNAKNDTTGNGAGAVVRLQATSIASVEMSNSGLGYTNAPAIEVQSGANNAAYATVQMMPFGISGDSMETFGSRVWIANPAPSRFDTIPPGGNFAVSAPGSVWDFATSDAGVLFTNSDGFLQTQYTNIKQSSGYNYLFGDGSISIVSGLQTSGNPATTTFSYQNVDPQAGLSWRDTAQDFSKTILFANNTGVFGLYGGVATKVSSKIDKLFQQAIFPPTPGALLPTAAVATIFNIKHYIMTMTTRDPDTGSLRNLAIAWNERDWFIVSQSVALTYLATQKVDSQFTAWGTDTINLFKLFQTPSVNLVKRLDTKFYGGPLLDMIKDVVNFYIAAGDWSGQGFTMFAAFDMAGGILPQASDPDFDSVVGGVVTANTFVQAQPTFPAESNGTIGVWGTRTGGATGIFAGLRLVSFGADFSLNNIQISYTDAAPYQ